MRLTAEPPWERFVSGDEVPVSSAGRPGQTTPHEEASGAGIQIESFCTPKFDRSRLDRRMHSANPQPAPRPLTPSSLPATLPAYIDCALEGLDVVLLQDGEHLAGNGDGGVRAEGGAFVVDDDDERVLPGGA